VIILKCIFFFLLSASASFATERFSPTLNFSFGMVNLSVTENQSTLVATDTDVNVPETVAGVAAASVTSFELNYEFAQTQKRGFFGKAIVPLMSPDGSGVFQGNLGVNFYLNSLSTTFSVIEAGGQFRVKPKLRYYWGVSTGVGYLVYNTESAKKSDVFFDLSLHGGGGYTFSDRWGMRAELSVGRAVGSATTSIATKLLIGASYFM